VYPVETGRELKTCLSGELLGGQDVLMTDLFSALGLARRPWLEQEEIKRRFLEASAQAHPDRFHSATAREKAGAEDHFAVLNSAQSTLRNPRERLVHFLALEGIALGGHVQNVPAAAMEFFGSVGQLTREVDAFLAEKGKVTSPMMKVQLFQKGLDWTDKLQELSGRLTSRTEAAYAEVKQLDALWTSALQDERQQVLRRLEEIARALAFLERWRAQLQERIHALAF
jgi:curved DNA-binding protein CbpA